MLITVCRRYHELDKNLRAAARLFGEFGSRPQVVVVWARPEPARLWLMKELVAAGLIDHLVGRPPLPDEGPGLPTTHPESHNIRLGLEFVGEHYGPDCFVVVQAADVLPKPGAYRYMAERLGGEGRGAVVLAMECSHHGHTWHTNFFGVGMDRSYWPPLSPPNHPDILERQWGILLQDRVRSGEASSWNNLNERFFAHSHDSERWPPAFEIPVTACGWPTLFVEGVLPFWPRLWLGVSNFWRSLWRRLSRTTTR